MEAGLCCALLPFTAVLSKFDAKNVASNVAGPASVLPPPTVFFLLRHYESMCMRDGEGGK